MACDYVLLESAQEEYRDIVDYLLAVSDGPSAARSFSDGFESLMRDVCDNPFGRRLSRIPEVAALGYRSAIMGRYVVLYSFREGRVLVAHIFHQRRDYARLV